MKVQSKPILVLASTSKYRAEILAKLGLDFIQIASNIDERLVELEAPSSRALRLSAEKATSVNLLLSEDQRPALIIGSDQVAHIDGTILRKPGSFDTAFQQLKASSGKSVKFETAVSIFSTENQQTQSILEVCTVNFKNLSDSQIENYLHKEQPFDCCGSFKSEGLGIALFESIEITDPNTLVGLPLIALCKLLSQYGIEVI